MGHSVYTRVGTLHRWVGAGTPITFQLQKEHQDSPTIYHRHKGVYASNFKIASAASGQAAYTVGTIGKGDEVRPGTDVGGTVTNDGPFVATNYFDGSLLQDNTALTGADNFSFLIDNMMTGKDAYFLAGQRAAINIGVQEISGDLGKIFTTEDGDTFYDAALNDTVTRLEFYYANKPLSGGADDVVPVRHPRGAVLADRAGRRRRSDRGSEPALDRADPDCGQPGIGHRHWRRLRRPSPSRRRRTSTSRSTAAP